MRTERVRAFTLIELLVSISIIAVLLGLVLPLMGRAVGQARAFRCQMSLRSVAFDFGLFANDELGPDRGEDDSLRRGSFRVETFQESLYGIDEFWRWEGETTHRMPDAQGADPLRCAAVRGELVLQRNTPCSQGAVGPARHVSFGFNMRLHRPEVKLPGGQFGTAQAWLKGGILDNANVPLAWDVDGAQAEQREVSPVFSMPSLDSRTEPGDRLWFPGLRHNGSLNAAFVDGHVASSRRPLEEPDWAWGFQPEK